MLFGHISNLCAKYWQWKLHYTFFSTLFIVIKAHVNEHKENYFYFLRFCLLLKKYYWVDAYKNLLKRKTNEFIFLGQWESCSIWSPKNYSNKGQSSTRFNCFATEDTSEEGTSLGYPGSGPAQGLCRVSFTTENRQHRRPTQDGSYEAVLALYTDHALFLRRDSLLYVLESL